VVPVEAFLSHSSKDRSFANRIYSLLVGHGIPVFYSKTNILGAQQWHDEIGEALKRCDCFIVILSPSSVSSEWIKRELLYVLQAERYKGRIVPLLYKPCNEERLSWTLPGFQRIDFTHDFHEGCRRLLAIWGLGYRGTLPGKMKKRSPKVPSHKKKKVR
jgi:hypothetical protein